MRKLLKNNPFGLPQYQVIRGTESSRIEQLSDAIFALAVTMLLISLEAPKTYEELLFFVSDFLVFIICIAAITRIWYEHYLFFLRYGLKDRPTIIINTWLLALVLFYVYPLKFFTGSFVHYFYYLVTGHWATTAATGYEASVTTALTWDTTPQIMLLYSLGYLGIVVSFTLFHRHALRRSRFLAMDEEEYRQTKQRAYKNGAQTIIALLSIALALLAIFTPAKWLAILSGWIYFLIWPAVVLAGRVARKKRQKDSSADEQPPAPPDSLSTEISEAGSRQK